MEEMYKIQEELKEAKEEIKNKGDELFKIRDLTQRGAYMGLNVHVMCKYICNKVGLIVKGPHV